MPENREVKKMKFSFFHQRHLLSTSFDIFVVICRVTNFLPKLLNMLLFSAGKKKLNLHFLNSPVFGYCLRVRLSHIGSTTTVSKSFFCSTICTVISLGTLAKVYAPSQFIGGHE